MTTPDTFRELLKRVEEATGPDRQLDRAIMIALFPDWGYGPFIAGEEEIFLHAPEPYYKRPCPDLTASLDDAYALADRLLPGCPIGLNVAEDEDGNAILDENGNVCWYGEEIRSIVFGPTPLRPLAVIGAALAVLLDRAITEAP